MKRVQTGERIFHVFNRGARRLTLFYEDTDYRMFLGLLSRALQRSGCLLYAYCLMSNHYHLILKGTSEQLTLCMRLLDWKYAMYHNRRHRLKGHVFDGPYRAYRQRSLWSIFWRIAYVFLNPVLAGIAREPGSYAWSGYKSFLGVPGSPMRVTRPEEMIHLGPDRESANREFLKILQDVQAYELSKTSRGPRAIDVNQVQFEWLMKRAHERLDKCAGERPTLVAMYWGHDAGIPPRAMAKSLGEPNVGKVRSALSRFRARLEANPELLQRLGQP